MPRKEEEPHLSEGDPGAGDTSKGASAETLSLVDQGQPVFQSGQMVVLQQQLAAARAELERQRSLRRDRKKRWEERHPEEARRKHAEYERARYARRRQQATGSSDSEPGGRSPAP